MIQQTFKEIERTDKLLFICPFCDKTFRALAYHTRQIHKISARHLRKMFGLKSDYQLITNDLRELHRNYALRDNMGEQLKSSGKNTRFKTGHTGHIKENWSNQALHEMSINMSLKNLKKVELI